MAKITDLHEFFEEHNDDFLKFERVANKLHKRPDLHAFLLLDQLVPGDTYMVCAAEHDEYYLDTEIEALLEVATEEQLLDLHRCGVRCGECGLCMFA